MHLSQASLNHLIENQRELLQISAAHHLSLKNSILLILGERMINRTWSRHIPRGTGMDSLSETDGAQLRILLRRTPNKLVCKFAHRVLIPW